MPKILPIDTPPLGDRSYLVHDGRVAFVVDPQRDIDRVLALADAEGVTITHVFETHIHNDYVTGGFALARRTGAAYHVNADDPVSFERVPVRDGDVVAVGAVMRLRVRHTPGHTFTHLSYVLEEHSRPVAVFSGGSLLFGSVGRPDLLGTEHTETLVHRQYASANGLAADLPDGTALYPTHGFGSFCAATQSEAVTSTIGQEKRTNPALTTPERQFVEDLLAGLDAWPAYYAHMAPANTAGPDEPDLTPPQRADAEQVRRRVAAGEWVVDLRNRVAFAAGHVAGTLNFGLDGSFATYLGWLIPWGTPLTLLGETPRQVADAQRELIRIGIDRPAAHAVGDPAGWAVDGRLDSFPRATFTDLAQVRHHRPVTVLDVRRNLEHAAGHLDNVVHIPLHELPHRLGEVPDDEVWVHCAAGYRAAVAASILDAAGRRVVAVDDEFPNAAEAGLPVTPGARQDTGAGHR
ncbi:MBL fold metallo-hydrolase [Dactylosporangium fulvum]|uniref:Rhodanese-like domain-containing protein n=1 Tax=Dactylosporangium fulvum TaxID=53359 RepID=A0ABY5WDR6_9ACTN|nr:rhodanese-like domain-containing protein [Dactylosporangium fulvum]UWP86546.1 rhodanese-like domain-containing protein [Dactylosporangium fulvum]